MSRRLVPVAVAVVLLGGLGSVAWLVRTGEGSPGVPLPEAPSDGGSNGGSDGVELLPRAELELGVYLDLWERSRRGSYVARGRERRWSMAGDDETVLGEVGYHHAREEGRSLEMLGATALLTEAGTTRTCEVLDASAGTASPLFCDAGAPALTAADERRLVEAELAGRYRLYEGTEEGCVELVGDGPIVFGRFGQSMTACFDDVTGALVREETFQGNRRRRLLVTSVESNPPAEAFDPVGMAAEVAVAGG